MTFKLGNLNANMSNSAYGSAHSYRVPTGDTITAVLTDKYFDGVKHLFKAGDTINVYDPNNREFARLGITGVHPKDGVKAARLDTPDVNDNPLAIAGFGDSRLGYDVTVSGNSYIHYANGMMNWANYFSKDRFSFNSTLDLGVSGNSTTQIAARLSDLDTAKTNNPNLHAIAYMGSTNDVNSAIALSTIKDNSKTIFDGILARGFMLYIFEEFARNDWTSSDATVINAAQEKQQDINAYYHEYAAQYPDRVRVIKLYDLFRDYGTEPKSNVLYLQDDGVHQEVNGAILAGRALSDAVVADFGYGESLDYSKDGLMVNPFLAAGGGTDSSYYLTISEGADLIPANWSVETSLTDVPGNVLAISRQPDGALRLDMTFGAGGGTSSLIRLAQNPELSAGNYAAGDTLQGVADINVIESENAKAVTMRITDDCTGTDFDYYAMQKTNEARMKADLIGRGILATEQYDTQSDTVKQRMRFDLVVDATDGGKLVVDVYGIDIKNL